MMFGHKNTCSGSTKCSPLQVFLCLYRVKPLAMKTIRDVMWHLGTPDLLKCVCIEHQQKRISLVRIEHNGQDNTIILRFWVGCFRKNWLSWITMCLRPYGCCVCVYIDAQEQVSKCLLLLLIQTNTIGHAVVTRINGDDSSA